jgi:hypothetical protein
VRQLARQVVHLLIEGKKRALDTSIKGPGWRWNARKAREKLWLLLQQGANTLLTSAVLLVKTHARLLRAILCGELLRAPPELLLEGNVSRALHWCHESREVPLLFFDERDTLFLQPQLCVEQLVNVLLIHFALSRHFQPELLTRFPLLCRQFIEPRREAGIGLRQLFHLAISQSDPVLGNLGGALAELLFQDRPSRLRKWASDGLPAKTGCTDRERHHRQLERSVHGPNHY